MIYMDTRTESRICKEYKAGASPIQLALKYGVSYWTVVKILKKYGIERRTMSEAKRKYCVDHNHFMVIDSPSKAYWLGFIVAEKYLSPKSRTRSAELVVRLALRDESHLRKLLDEADSNYPIHKYPIGGRQFCSIKIKSNQLVHDMHRHGVPYARELARFPTSLKPRFHNHFIRGLWDGDGTLYRSNGGDWNWSICGQLALLSHIQGILVKHCHLNMTKVTRDSRKMETYVLRYGGNLQVPRIIEWLYKGSNPFMRLDRNNRRVAAMFSDLKSRGVKLCQVRRAARQLNLPPSKENR